MRHKALLMNVLLCMAVQAAWAWDGSGTPTDPYLIKDNADWRQLARQVSNGYNFQGMFFEMTADIDAVGIRHW